MVDIFNSCKIKYIICRKIIKKIKNRYLSVVPFALSKISSSYVSGFLPKKSEHFKENIDFFEFVKIEDMIPMTTNPLA